MMAAVLIGARNDTLEEVGKSSPRTRDKLKQLAPPPQMDLFG
jgi:hypothetical protein